MFVYNTLYGHMFSTLLDGYLEVELLDCMLKLFLLFKKLPSCLTNWLYHFTFKLVVYVGSSFSIVLNLTVSVFFIGAFGVA